MTLSGITTSAQKTITVTTNEPVGLTVLNPKDYQPLSWNGNSLSVTVPDGYSLQLQTKGNYEVTNIKMDDTDLGTNTYIENHRLVDGGTLTVTIAEKQPKTLVIKGDGDQVYVSCNYQSLYKDSQKDGKWILENLEDYGTTYVYPNDGNALKSVKDSKGNEYFYPGNSYASIYHGSLPSGTTEITVISYNKAETRTASFSVEVTGDASVISIQRNGENSSVPVSEFADIKFDPENELPITIGHQQYGKTLYKVFVGDELQTPQGSAYRLNNITNGCKVKIETDYPDIKVPVKFVFANEGTEGVISSVSVDNSPLEKDAWLDNDFKIALGKQVYISTNSQDYNINSFLVNGQCTQSFTVTDESGYTITVDATKIEPYKLTVTTADWQNVVIGQPYTDPYISFPLTGEETVLEIPRSCYSVEVKAKDGYKLDHIYETGTENELSSPLYLSGDKSIEVYVSEFKRDKTAVVYFEETAWQYKNITLNPNDYVLRKEVTPTTGYNFINYHESDRPFGIGAYPNPVVYLNGDKIESNYGNYPALETMPENSVIKVFTAEPEMHNVTYSVGNNVNVQIAHDYLNIVDNPSAHNVQHGTHVVIKPIAREGIVVKANNKDITADDKGQFIIPVTEDTAISIGDNGAVSVSELDAEDNTPFNVFNLQGICILENASKENLNSLPAGMYIVNGKKFVKK